MRVRLAYGKSGLWLELPDQPPATVIEPQFVPGLPDEADALRSALRSPIGTPPLREILSPDDSIAVVFSDLTRPMPNDRVLPVLLDELAGAGVPDGRIRLINALGTHRAQTLAELQGMLGPEIATRYQIVQHDAWDTAGMVPVGKNSAGHVVRVNRAYLSASVRILTGFIEPHFFAGFSGGPKAVMPGLADVDSILDNHGPALLAHEQATWAVTAGNPVWEDMLAIAQSTRPTFVLNVTLNQDRKISGVFAGSLCAAHGAGVEFARKAAMCPVPQPFDIVITSNSGYPLDLNLYQAVKGMSAAAQIVRPGGDIVVAAECWDGIPAHGEYRRLLSEAASPSELLARLLAPGFRCQDQWEAQMQAQIQVKARVHLYAGGLSDEEVRQALLIPCRSIEETVAVIRLKKPTASIAVLPDGPQTVPYLKHATETQSI